MKHPLDRRTVMKAMASSAFFADRFLAGCGSKECQPLAAFTAWAEVAPGVWKSTFGRTEAHTPATSRRIAPAVEGLRALPVVTAPPLVLPSGLLTASWCRVFDAA